ncbi:MAG: primosomal protein N' [Spirochaetaceae bacterium]|nr:primosomal protein N' [Spirochaetaceae bacterium]
MPEKIKYLQVVFNTPVDSSFTYTSPDEKSIIGYRVIAPFGKRSMTGFTVSESFEKPLGKYKIKAITRVVDKKKLFGKAEIELAKWISSMYFCTLGESLSSMLPGGRRDSLVPAFDTEDPVSEIPRVLSDEQIYAVDNIISSEKKIHYLYGITGSGKTEVFLQAAEKVISSGKSVIYLVPEISLTHQLTGQVRRRFNNRVAILHSALTPSQRLVEWHKVKSGESVLVIGARSAIFAPAVDLGLIIIDEEHEGSYKSGRTPRYHARQVAMKRASLANAHLVMGSATPSVEAFSLMDEGRIFRLNLSRRLSGGTVPENRIINMNNSPGPFSRELLEEIKNTYNMGKQTILFLNRRGFSYFFHCRSCGWDMKCKHCSVSMTYHKESNRMVCHYCGAIQAPVSICPSCRSLDVGYSGFGTELIESEIKKYFPNLIIARIDSDSVKTKNYLANTLKDFKEQKIDILLGTQMVAKGLNFPGVRLIGIISADSGLHLPDFRAGERTFSLITQVSGRAGRYTPDGLVLIQTFDPSNNAIRLAAENKQEEYYRDEISKRKMLGFPPFSRLIRLVFRGPDESTVINYADRVHVSLMEWKLDKTEILGPAECPIKKISRNFRYQILLRTNNFNVAHEAVYHLKQIVTKSKVYMEIDVDPVSLL